MYPNCGKIKNAFLEPDFTNVKIKMTLSIVEQIRFENILNIQNELKKGRHVEWSNFTTFVFGRGIRAIK